MLRASTACVMVSGLALCCWAKPLPNQSQDGQENPPRAGAGIRSDEILKTEMPEEILVGTPPEVLALLFPGLEKLAEEPPEFLVAAGTVNLALGKAVTSSDPNPIFGKLGFVTDGSKQGADDNFLELSPGLQWVQIDLERPCRIGAVYLWHYFREARSYHDVIVQVADDAKFTRNVRTLYNNDQDNSAGLGLGTKRPYIETNLGRLIDARGALARYVRLYSSGNTANNTNHYVEVEVFGKAVSAEHGPDR